ncbi:MAG: hypothetical protein IKV35_06575 [Clostridia bacterium]|nr:hypothetical protein [Clostridia bacterium]
MAIGSVHPMAGMSSSSRIAVYVSKVSCDSGTVSSLLPYGGEVRGVTVRGAAYELEDATLDTAFPIGVSNAFVSKTVEISVKDGYLLMILAKES